ncbi:hypothetical protein JX266_012504 [Neoarthrinium moseri]|nr:hypothetical protein JX266_012504 [Neoarthrinium moseri]
MQFKLLTIVGFAAAVLAAPQVGTDIPSIPGDLTVGQADAICGSDTSLSCCNKVDQSGDAISIADGLLSGLLGNALSGGLGLFDGCSKLSLPLGIVGGGVGDLLNSQCKQTAACCQGTDSDQDGLVNVGLPCVALGGLL